MFLDSYQVELLFYSKLRKSYKNKKWRIVKAMLSVNSVQLCKQLSTCDYIYSSSPPHADLYSNNDSKLGLRTIGFMPLCDSTLSVMLCLVGYHWLVSLALHFRCSIYNVCPVLSWNFSVEIWGATVSDKYCQDMTWFLLLSRILPLFCLSTLAVLELL